jgi:hypothetical protein
MIRQSEDVPDAPGLEILRSEFSIKGMNFIFSFLPIL